MQQESIYIDDGENQLHLRHIWKNNGGVPIFMLHGLIENSFIFYTEKGKGLACFLAEQGFDVYVGDLRGRGKSHPAINAKSSFGQHEAITRDIPLFLEKIQSLNPQKNAPNRPFMGWCINNKFSGPLSRVAWQSTQQSVFWYQASC